MKFYFTFGLDSPLARYYVEIEAEREIEAREKMHSWFTGHWASCYPWSQFEHQIQDYDLLKLEVNEDADTPLCTNVEALLGA